MNYATNNAMASTASEARKLPEVQSEVELLGLQLEYLGKSVERLADKLVPVLANRPVEAGVSQSAPEPVRVPLADVLHERYLMLCGLARRIDELCERVEL